MKQDTKSRNSKTIIKFDHMRFENLCMAKKNAINSLKINGTRENFSTHVTDNTCFISYFTKNSYKSIFYRN